MTEIILPQAEADDLIAMEKHAAQTEPVTLPDLGGALSCPLVSSDRREDFVLDVSRGRIDLRKGTNQMRSRQVIVLVRLDYGGPPHRNPDGEEIACPHIHIYREGYGDKWALPLPDDVFVNIGDHWQILHDFSRYCNITQPPNFQRGLFS